MSVRVQGQVLCLCDFLNLHILSFEVLPCTSHTFLPPDGHAPDGIEEHFWRSLAQDEPHSVLYFFDVGKFGATQLLLQVGKMAKSQGQDLDYKGDDPRG